MSSRLKRTARLAVDLLREPRARHRARARLAAERRRAELAWHRYRIRRRQPGREIVVIGLVEHLGDIVAAEPVARHLRREHPDAYLVWAVRETYRELVEHHPALDAILPLGCLTEWIHLAGSRLFDRVVDLHVQGRDCAICKLPLIRPGGDRGVNFGTYYALGNLLHVFTRVAGLPPLDEAPRVYIPRSASARVDALGLPAAYAVVHCTSNQVERDWSAAKWRELTEEILATCGVEVVEVGLRPVVGGRRIGYTDLCGKLSILETAEVIRRAEVFIGIDSGPAHLANAVGTYGIILLGEYGPFERYLPYSGGYASGANADILYADGPAASLSVGRVLQSLAARPGKRSPPSGAQTTRGRV